VERSGSINSAPRKYWRAERRKCRQSECRWRGSRAGVVTARFVVAQLVIARGVIDGKRERANAWVIDIVTRSGCGCCVFCRFTGSATTAAWSGRKFAGAVDAL
jgi:hypothetical protein